MMDNARLRQVIRSNKPPLYFQHQVLLLALLLAPGALLAMQVVAEWLRLPLASTSPDPGADRSKRSAIWGRTA